MRLTIEPKPYKEWNRWFAWHPIWISNTWVWLETVERKFVCITEGGVFYEYRLID